jgi:hypothetical protein
LVAGGRAEGAWAAATPHRVKAATPAAQRCVFKMMLLLLVYGFSRLMGDLVETER